MKKIIRKILKEDRRQEFLNKIIKVMKNDFPLFKNMKDYGLYDQLSKDELNYIFSEIFGKPVRHSYEIIMNKLQGRILDKKGYSIYYEESDNGYWYKREYDENNKEIYYESFEGTDVEEIKYIVKNHMKVKPKTWEVMKDSKKEPLSDSS